MPMTAEQFAALFVPVEVEDEEWWALKISVGQYRNAKYNVDLALKDQLLGHLKHGKDKPGTGIISGYSGGYSIPDCGIESFPAPRLMHAFCGKALPDEAAEVISIFSHWKNHSKAAKGCKYQTLQGFADGCLGTDCNGLVGGFLKSQYPMTGYGPSTDIGSYHNQGTKRKGLTELAANDCLIFNENHHIAIISEITRQDATKAECRITQSRGQKLGGAQTGIGTITFKNKAFFLNSTQLKSIVKVRGMT